MLPRIWWERGIMLDKWAQKPVSSEERSPTNLYGHRSQNTLLKSYFRIRPRYHDSGRTA
ncbi:unnamed protein product, partial [Heterotrigona itama]